MSKKRKAYNPVIRDDEHLVPSRKTPGRVRGLSQNSNNKNTDIPEWEEEEIREKTATDGIFEVAGKLALLYGGYKLIKHKAFPWVKDRIESNHTKQKDGKNVQELIDATDLIERFERAYKTEDLSKTEIQKLLLENYLMALRIAKNNQRLASGGIIIDNDKIFEFIENEEICAKLNSLLSANRGVIGEELWQDYYDLFRDYSDGKEVVCLTTANVRRMIESL